MKERDSQESGHPTGVFLSGGYVLRLRACRARPHRCSDTHGRKTLEKYRLEAITE
jgi:hypothetical protein